MSAATEQRIAMRLASDPMEVDRVCRRVMALFSEADLQPFHFAVELVVRELLNNAIVHGNRRNRRKTVAFKLQIDKHWIRVTVADQGAGFDWQQVLQSAPDAGAVSGRGLAIVRLYTRHLSFGDCGRRIEARFERCVPPRTA